MRLSRFEWGCIVVLIAAALVRASFLLAPNFIWDSAWFLMLARSFGDTHTFLIRWSDPSAPEYSGYWPPLFPIFVSPFVKIFGASFRTLVLASDVAAALLVLGVFLTTRDLFDRPRAFAAAAIIAASPAFYVSDAKGMSESLLGLAVLLTVWAFIRSLTRPAWLPIAAGFAALAYLGKASLGLPFVAVGIVALAAWRVRTRGWRTVARSPIDISVMLGGLVVLAILALTRSEKIGGLGLGLIEPLSRGILHADCGELAGQLIAMPAPFHLFGAECWLAAFPLKLFFVAAFLFVVTLPLSFALPQLVRAPRTERTDALWLAVLLPLVAGAVFTTTFFFTEHRSFVDFDNIRYLTPAIVPFVWLLLPFTTFEDEPRTLDDRPLRRHVTWYWIAVGALVALALFNPLTGSETLERFQILLVLSIVPLGLALVAASMGYRIQERRVGRDVELRYVEEKARGPERVVIGIAIAVVALAALLLPTVGVFLVSYAGVGMAILVLAALVALAALRRSRAIGGLAAFVLFLFAAWYYSSWYAVVGLGLAVALATRSPARRAVAMSLLLLVSAAPTTFQAIPVDKMADALSGLPQGTLVGISDIAVYPAAVAPDNVRVRMVDPDKPVPGDINVLAMQSDLGEREYANFTKVASWNYEFTFWPTISARVLFEEKVLGNSAELPQVPGISLYVRNGTGLEKDLRR